MFRLEGLSQAIWESVPGWLVEPMGVVTSFGGATVLLFALSLLYWLDDRRSTATVVGYAFVALAAVLLIALSRVVLGMHYLGDVIVGVLLGAAVLAACWRYVGERPGPRSHRQ